MISFSRICVAGAILALVGCASARPAEPPPVGAPLPQPPPGTGPHMLLGVNWHVLEFGHVPVIEGSSVMLHFADGQVTGNSGCNRLTGSYQAGEAAGDGPLAISFGPLAMTKMACPEERMAQEQAFTALLQAVTSYTFDPAGNLLLAAPDGRWIKARRG